MRLDELIPILLVQIGLVLGLSRLLGALCARFQQPQVVGEMAAGIMLGPSLLGLASTYMLQHGWVHINIHTALFPAESIPFLGMLSQIGVILFLFVIGLELDPKLLRNRGHAALVISHVSIVAPFLLGAALTLYLYPRVFNDTPVMRFTPVALFMGAAMSVTAFPVLARILTERNLSRTNVGSIAITCAAVDDVTAWCMLAFVVGVARANGLQAAIATAVLSAGYVLVMFLVVRPFVARLRLLYERQGSVSQNVFAIVLLLTLASAWTTERIGIHALFGAFLMGAIMPKDSGFVQALVERLEYLTVVFLLPIFFAYTGLKTQIGLLNSVELWAITGLVVLVACAGKFGGSTLAGRLCGMSWRDSAAVGALMNTRGLMGLVIVDVGRDLGVISPVVFAMMIIMALLTTVLTTPALQLILPQRIYGAVTKQGVKPRRGFSVLIPVAYPKSGGPLLQLASTLIDPPATDGSTERTVLALHLRRPEDRDAYHPGAKPTPAPGEPLRPLLALAEKLNLSVEAISFSTRDIAGGIVQVAGERQASLVLMGSHHSIFRRTLFGGIVHKVLEDAETDVAIFVDRGYKGARRILVPYIGSEHDKLAVRLAARVARGSAAQITVLHVNSPESRFVKANVAKADVERAIATMTGVTFDFRSIDDDSPIDAVLRHAPDFDLIAVGVSEEWGLEANIFGLRPERIAQDSPTSMLIVRKHGETRETPPPIAAQTTEVSSAK